MMSDEDFLKNRRSYYTKYATSLYDPEEEERLKK